MSNKLKIALVCVSLFSLTFGLYFQTNNYEFINLDDGLYVYTNSMVVKGLNLEALKYVFSMQHIKDTICYHPITAITYLIDVSLFGVDSGAMHLFNAVIHSINGVWLFLFLMLLYKKNISKEVGTSENICNTRVCKDSHTHIIVAIVGALFWVLHPLRVEVVAWVASRKDVMCMFFMLPGLMAHLYGKRTGSKKHIVISTICFLLAFLCKPTSVVYPLLAMILEFVETRNIVWKKNAGFIYIMIIMMMWTIFVQHTGGGMSCGLPTTLRVRIETFFVGIGQYVGTTVFPHNLHPLYKHELPLPIFRTILGMILTSLCLLLLAIKIPLLKNIYKNKGEDITFSPHYCTILVLVGFVWYFVALAPVSGLISFGFTPWADRFTYLPSIGFSMVVSALLLYLSKRTTKRLFYATTLICLLFVVGLSVKTWYQTKNWKNDLTLFTYATQVDEENYNAFASLSMHYLFSTDLPLSLTTMVAGVKASCFLQSCNIATSIRRDLLPTLVIVFSAIEGEPLEIEQFPLKNRYSVQHSRIYKATISDDDPLAVQKLLAQGLYAYKDELFPQAKEYFERALKLSPSDRMAWAIYGDVLERLGDKTGAIDAYNESLKLKYDHRLAKKLKKKTEKM